MASFATLRQDTAVRDIDMSETNTRDTARQPAPAAGSDGDAVWHAIAPTPGGARIDGEPDLVLRMQELERRRIALNLHDDLGPLITLIGLELQNAGKHAGTPAGDAALARAGQNVARAFAQLRRTVLDLHPVMLDDLGLVHALGWLIRQFERSGGAARIDRQLDADEQAVPQALKPTIFRICQEALNNIARHAGASHARVTLAIDGGCLRLAIEDDGCGIAAAASELAGRSGGGLAGIMRRAAASGGQCRIETARGHGTRIAVTWTVAP